MRSYTSSDTARILLGAAFAAAASLAAAPTLAAETVMVELVGERGGEMAVNIDKPEVPAGEVTFQVANVANDTPHEMVVVMVDEAGQQFVVDPETNKVDETALDDLGEVEGLKAGETGELTLTLEPGNYQLLCNYKGHYAAGMYVPFTVTEASS